MNFRSQADIAIYPYESRFDILERIGPVIVDGMLELTSHIMVHTVADAEPFKPTRIELISKLNARVFERVELVEIRDNQTVVSMFLPRQSGTSEGAKQVYMIIMPPGTLSFSWSDKFNKPIYSPDARAWFDRWHQQ